MIKYTICVFAFLFASMGANASNILGGSLEYQIWKTAPKGTFGEAADSKLDLDRKSKNQFTLSIAFEHPLLFTPNLKLSYTEVKTSGSSKLTQTYLLDHQLYNVASSLSSTTQVKQFDVVGYYELLDNRIMELDVGILLRQHNIDINLVNLDNPIETSERSVTEISPMLYASGSYLLPLLDLGGFVEASYQDNDNYDYQFGVSYRLLSNAFFDAFVKLGVRKQNLDIDNLSGLYFEHNWQSTFVSLKANF